MTQGQVDRFGLRPHAVAVHDCLDVTVLDLDVCPHFGHTPRVHLRCTLGVLTRRRTPQSWELGEDLLTLIDPRSKVALACSSSRPKSVTTSASVSRASTTASWRQAR